MLLHGRICTLQPRRAALVKFCNISVQIVRVSVCLTMMQRDYDGLDLRSLRLGVLWSIHAERRSGYRAPRVQSCSQPPPSARNPLQTCSIATPSRVVVQSPNHELSVFVEFLVHALCDLCRVEAKNISVVGQHPRTPRGVPVGVSRNAQRGCGDTMDRREWPAAESLANLYGYYRCV